MKRNSDLILITSYAHPLSQHQWRRNPMVDRPDRLQRAADVPFPAHIGAQVLRQSRQRSHTVQSSLSGAGRCSLVGYGLNRDPKNVEWNGSWTRVPRCQWV